MLPFGFQECRTGQIKDLAANHYDTFTIFRPPDIEVLRLDYLLHCLFADFNSFAPRISSGLVSSTSILWTFQAGTYAWISIEENLEDCDHCEKREQCRTEATEIAAEFVEISGMGNELISASMTDAARDELYDNVACGSTSLLPVTVR